MEERERNVVPYIVYEGERARNERHVKRLIVALVVTILLLFASNALWLYCWMQYDYVGEVDATQQIDVDAKDGVANYIGNDGDIVNGSYRSDEKESIQESPEEESE